MKKFTKIILLLGVILGAGLKIRDSVMLGSLACGLNVSPCSGIFRFALELILWVVIVSAVVFAVAYLIRMAVSGKEHEEPVEEEVKTEEVKTEAKKKVKKKKVKKIKKKKQQKDAEEEDEEEQDEEEEETEEEKEESEDEPEEEEEKTEEEPEEEINL